MTESKLYKYIFEITMIQKIQDVSNLMSQWGTGVDFVGFPAGYSFSIDLPDLNMELLDLVIDRIRTALEADGHRDVRVVYVGREEIDEQDQNDVSTVQTE